MPESIERLVRGFSVLRLLSIATLLLVVACLVISASIALADTLPASGEAIDVYEFDFALEAEAPPNPEIEELIALEDI